MASPIPEMLACPPPRQALAGTLIPQVHLNSAMKTGAVVNQLRTLILEAYI